MYVCGANFNAISRTSISYGCDTKYLHKFLYALHCRVHHVLKESETYRQVSAVTNGVAACVLDCDTTIDIVSCQFLKQTTLHQFVDTYSHFS